MTAPTETTAKYLPAFTEAIGVDEVEILDCAAKLTEACTYLAKEMPDLACDLAGRAFQLVAAVRDELDRKRRDAVRLTIVRPRARRSA